MLTDFTEREAMWIRFSSDKQFVVKVYVSGVNAVSGEPAQETQATMSRRINSMQMGKNIHDYMITPPWACLDGVASTGGVIRQLVAMPLSKGYTVESQITSEDVVLGLQLEVTHVGEIADGHQALPCDRTHVGGKFRSTRRVGFA